ncbi:MAG: hypothetical protein ACEROO_02215, partial [Candidatus Bathyarchaeota archaeon]
KREGVGKVGNLAYFINLKEKIGERYVVKINLTKRWLSTYRKRTGMDGSSAQNVENGLGFQAWIHG